MYSDKSVMGWLVGFVGIGTDKKFVVVVGMRVDMGYVLDIMVV